MSFVITYTDRETGEQKRIEVNAKMDVVGIEIPEQESEGLPGLKVDVNTDAVIVHTANGSKLSQHDFTELLNDAVDDLNEDDTRFVKARDYDYTRLDRGECVALLEGVDIQCYDEETVETLREAVAVNVKDGTIDYDDLPE